MTIAYKILGQSVPATNTWTTIYTVPTGNSAVLSTVSVCNTSNAINGRYQLAVTKSGISAPTDLNSNTFIVCNSAVANNDTLFLTLGLTLGANDSVRANVTTGNASLVFNLFGSEIY